MTDPVFNLCREFRRRARLLCTPEHGVVPEPSIPARCFEHASSPEPLADAGKRIVRRPQINHHTNKKAVARNLPSGAQRLKQMKNIRLIISCISGIARGAHPRCAAKGGYDQTRIISNGRSVAENGRMARFEESVFKKRLTRFLGSRDPVLRQRCQGQRQSSEQGRKLPELAPVGTGKDNLHEERGQRLRRSPELLPAAPADAQSRRQPDRA